MAKRIGLAREQALLEGLKREIKWGGTSFVGAAAVTLDNTAASSLTADDSGKLILINGGGITLPAASTAAGVKYTFLYVAGGVDLDISCSDANELNGFVMSSQDPTSGSNGLDLGVITFKTGSNNLGVGAAEYGDKVEMVCDGTRWLAACYCASGSAILISAGAE